MGSSFVFGVCAGIATSAAAWYIPNKSLVPRWDVRGWNRSEDGDGRPRYSFLVANAGRRDIVDVAISCTLFSTGWGDGNSKLRSAITIPISQGRIDFMPGRGYRSRADGWGEWGPRVVIIKPEEISDLQLAKLEDEQRKSIRQGRVELAELCSWGTASAVLVAVHGVDAVSGTRRVSRFPLPID